MKKIIISLIAISISSTIFAQGQFKIRNDQYIQIGYTGYKALTFGQSTGTPNNGNFSIEYCAGCTATGSGGLNFWKPWPTSGMANFLMYIRDNGNVGIGNNGDATFKLNISGTVRANSYSTFSDERLKTSFADVKQVLNRLNTIKVYEYKYKQFEQAKQDSVATNISKTNTPYSFDDNTHIGFKAQEVQKIFPDLVTKDENGYFSINYVEFVPLLLKAIQEQNEKIAKLEAQIDQLKK